MGLLNRVWRGAPTARHTLTPADLESWEEYGFLVLRQFFSGDEIEAVNEYIDRLWDQRRDVEEPIVLDYLLETDAAGRSLLRDSPETVRDWPYKLNDLYLASPSVLALSAHTALNGILAALLGGEPMVINTLNFERGSQQADHFDTFYMPAPVRNKMVATWVALEDIEPSTGPLRYYPGSNRLETFHFSHGQLWAVPEEAANAQRFVQEQVERAHLTMTTFTPRKGDVFIWHSQLLHGGSPIEDLKRTRKSLVTHYFRAEDFDLSQRSSMDPNDVQGQFRALGPSWRDAFINPVVCRTSDGQAFLDKWEIASAARVAKSCIERLD